MKFLCDRSDEFVVSLIAPASFRAGRLSRWLALISSFPALVVCDVVYVNPMEHCNLPASLLIHAARLLGKRVIVDFYLSGYDTYVLDRNRYQLGSLQANAMKSFDRIAMQYGDPIIYLNRSECRYYETLVGPFERKGSVDFCSLVVPDRESKSGRLSIKNDVFVIAWWGRLGNPIHGVEILLEAFALLKHREIRFKVYLFAQGTFEHIECLTRQIDHLRIDDVVAVDQTASFGNGQLQDRLVSCVNLALGIFGDTLKAHTVFPNKILDAFSLGIPVLTGENTAVVELTNQGELIMLQERTASAIADAVTSMMKNVDELEMIGARGHGAFDRFREDQFLSFVRERIFPVTKPLA